MMRIDVETRGLQRDDDPFDETAEIEFRFAAVNNTAFTLTIEKVVTKIGIRANPWETFTISQEVILPPSKDGNPLYCGFEGAHEPLISEQLKDEARRLHQRC
jgi:hypothetical protein